MIISLKDIYKAVRHLREKEFKVIVYEPYTITLARKGFVVDLYTQPSLAWIIRW
jgi:predicted methyltransferase